MTEENKGGMDPKMLAAIQTRSIEQQTLDVLVRIEELVREALRIYAKPTVLEQAVLKDLKEVSKQKGKLTKHGD